MFIALAYIWKFLVLRNYQNKSHYIFLKEPRVQCIPKTGRKNRILSRTKKTERRKIAA
jgi:hypothetical protein